MTPHHYRTFATIQLTRSLPHKCKGIVTNWRFWLGLTMGFPLEHLLWEKVWPFMLLSRALGL